MIVHGRHNEMMRKQEEPNNSIMKWRHKLCVCEKNNGIAIRYDDLPKFGNIVFKGRKCFNFFYSPDLQILFNGRHQQLDTPVDFYVSKSVQKIKESSNSRRVHAYF